MQKFRSEQKKTVNKVFLRVPSSKPLVQARMALRSFDPGIIRILYSSIFEYHIISEEKKQDNKIVQCTMKIVISYSACSQCKKNFA